MSTYFQFSRNLEQMEGNLCLFGFTFHGCTFIRTSFYIHGFQDRLMLKISKPRFNVLILYTQKNYLIVCSTTSFPLGPWKQVMLPG